MKISIITVLNTINYGSVLQTYATQKYLSDMGFDTEFVDFSRKDQKYGQIVKKTIFSKRNNLKQMIKKPIKDALDIISLGKSYRVFRGFLNRNIKMSKISYGSFEELVVNPPLADIYCTGSDQMWNSFWNNGIEKSFFLDYAQEKPRTAFCTSIGMTEFPIKDKEILLRLIKKYSFISVREKSAELLLKKYGISAYTAMDPTLLIEGCFWKKMATKRSVARPYLLVYQLHYDKHQGVVFNEAVRKIAESFSLDIIRITYSISDIQLGKKIVLPKVEEFISLFANADYVITDSFHGTAFSVNLNRPFSVIYPEQFSTRIECLLQLIGMEERKLSNINQIIGLERDISFDKVNEILKNKREECKHIFQERLKTVCLEKE